MYVDKNHLAEELLRNLGLRFIDLENGNIALVNEDYSTPNESISISNRTEIAGNFTFKNEGSEDKYHQFIQTGWIFREPYPNKYNPLEVSQIEYNHNHTKPSQQYKELSHLEKARIALESMVILANYLRDNGCTIIRVELIIQTSTMVKEYSYFEYLTFHKRRNLLGQNEIYPALNYEQAALIRLDF